MTKIRDRAGAVMIVVLALAFGGLWMLQDTGVFNAMGGGQQRSGNIMVVDGAPISAEEYGRTVNQQVQMMERQGREVTPQLRDQIGDRVYNQLITRQLAQQEMDRLGITVTEEEVYNAVLGENPDPIVQQVIRSMVPPERLPEDGQVDREFLQYIINQPNFEPVVQQLERVLRSRIRERKLQALLDATVHVSSKDVEDYHRRQNLTVDTRYVALPYAQVPDEEVSVSESDLQAYYEEHREDFRRPKTLRVQYVTHSKQATQEDTAAVLSDLEAMRKRFAQAENDSLFLQRRGSERSFSGAYQSASALDAAIADSLFPNPQTGQIVGPLFTGGQAHLVKVTGTQPAEEPSVHVRHILFEGNGEEALQQARKVKEQITSGQARFAAMARQHSADPGSAQQGGDLGWRSRGGGLAPAFEEAAFSAQPGQVVGPVKTSFGYHLIQVEARADQQVQIADLALSLRPSVATLSEIENTMRDVAVFAREEGNFESQAKRTELDIQTAQVSFNEEGELSLQPIQALGPSQQIKHFLTNAEAGATSDVVELDDQFAVLHVTETTPAGYRPLEEVRSQVEAQVLTQKKRAVQEKKLRQAAGQAEGNLDQVAEAVGTTVRSKTGVSFDTRTIPALGNDAEFVGTALGLDEGQTSRVVAGENGAFIVRATRVSEPSPLTEQERQQLRDKLQQQRRQQMRQQWIAGLREEAEIQDNRAQYQ